MTRCSVSISLVPDSHLKPVCGKEVETKPRSIPVLARSHRTASQLAWNIETFVCAHEDTAESYIRLEKRVAFGRVAPGGRGGRQTRFIKTISAWTYFRTLFLF